jgi:hypothetical protein
MKTVLSVTRLMGEKVATVSGVWCGLVVATALLAALAAYKG